ncbi:hypothetical protein BDV39DRAFT_202255 [Aspergillus sergii]|uniref:C2H2-type domain-containing protein n=1 Tax=Aspergillus sergii TaxID=1034303 RepID=A0A5N6X9Y6_9EURO|nr:hypothetical protein BDV39DRAFT_202255 [Aspergillus sergii]
MGRAAGPKKSRTCSYCHREFQRLEHLQRHVRLRMLPPQTSIDYALTFFWSDTNEKPYTCACGDGFARKDLLTRHQRLVHDGVDPSSSLHGEVSTPQLDNGAPVNAAPAEPDSRNPFVLHQLQGSTLTGPLQEGGLAEIDPDNHPEPSIVYPDSLNIIPSLEVFNNFVNNLGLAFDLDSPLNLGGRLSEYEHPPDASQRNGTRRSASGIPMVDDRTQPAQTGQVPTLLPIPLNPWCQAAVYIPLLKIDELQRANMIQELIPFQHLLPAFTIPSPESLTRFLNAYFDGVYLHMPFIHCASFDPAKHSLELVLAMMAAGAQYRYEHRKGRMLYYASKIIFQERQRFHSTTTDDLRCLLNLAIYANWQQDVELVRDACDYQSLLVRLLRETSLTENNATSAEVSCLDWQTWLQLEADRRVKLFGFAFLNLQSIAYNLPPIFLSDEINLRLPCTCDEWRTVDEAHWKQVRQGIHQEQSLFQDALFLLWSEESAIPVSPSKAIPSPTANLILIHGLLQRILLNRQAAMSPTMPEVGIFTNALGRWTSTWQLAPESSLDPLNPNGPIPFTSTALLGLAYTRLQLDLGPSRRLISRDPTDIARGLLMSPDIQRSPHLLPALLHATHALSIPVNLGVEYVSRSQAFVWSIQHALCGLEFAVLVDKWLKCIGRSMEKQPLKEHEQRLLDWIRRVVEEGRSSIDDGAPLSETLDCDRLAFYVVKLWARIMRGNAQWPFVDVIGHSLELYASGAGLSGSHP